MTDSSSKKNKNCELPFEVIYQDDKVLVMQTHTALATGDMEDQMLQPHQPSYGGQNLGLHVQDNPTQVLTHRMKLCADINRYLKESDLQNENSQNDDLRKKLPEIQRIHWLNQIHSDKVIALNKSSVLTMAVASADAMTYEMNEQLVIAADKEDAADANQYVALAIMTADCVPIVLSQYDTGQIAAIHAGWQGLEQGIIAETIKQFDMSAGEVKAWIGACISQTNYEVSMTVVDRLIAGGIKRNLFDEAQADSVRQRICLPQNESEIQLEKGDSNDGADNADDNKDVVKKASVKTANKERKAWLNLPELTKIQLQYAGVSQILTQKVPCSYASSRYYSYRRQTHLQQPATGRMAMIIASIG